MLCWKSNSERNWKKKLLVISRVPASIWLKTSVIFSITAFPNWSMVFLIAWTSSWARAEKIPRRTIAKDSRIESKIKRAPKKKKTRIAVELTRRTEVFWAHQEHDHFIKELFSLFIGFLFTRGHLRCFRRLWRRSIFFLSFSFWTKQASSWFLIENTTRFCLLLKIDFWKKKENTQAGLTNPLFFWNREKKKQNITRIPFTVFFFCLFCFFGGSRNTSGKKVNLPIQGDIEGTTKKKSIWRVKHVPISWNVYQKWGSHAWKIVQTLLDGEFTFM